MNNVTSPLAFVAMNVAALVCLLRKILIWSETHFSAWYDQSALFPTLFHTLLGKVLSVI